QKSDDWDRPRADRTAWQRLDHIWVAAGTGLTYRVERVIERREPARLEPTQRLTMRYELESQLVYPGRLYEDRLRDINQTKLLGEMADPYLREWNAASQRPLDSILSKIAYHIENYPETPYREGLLQLRR